MARNKLDPRRLCINRHVTFQSAAGREIKLVVTIGFSNDGNASEVFCADFRAGSDNQALVMDACILLSRLLQHGDTPAELLQSMCSPPSLIGTICKAICDEQNLAVTDGFSSGFEGRAPNVSRHDESEPRPS